MVSKIMATQVVVAAQTPGSSQRSGGVTEFGIPLNIEAEQHDISVAHDVLLAFRPDDALFLRAFPAARAHELIVAHRLTANEAALEIGVNHTRCLRRGVTLMDGPRADFLLARREVRLQSHQVVAGANEPIETGRLQA